MDKENKCEVPIKRRDANQSVHLVAGEGLEAYLPLSDMIDVSAEVERLSKRLSKMQEEFDRLAARLSSPKSVSSGNLDFCMVCGNKVNTKDMLQFVEKAPEEIVSGVREKAAEAEEKITLTKNRLAFLQSTAVVSK
ncbi:Valine--tRNA ligase, chloroplastic/mitochondrial 2 [Vitis vinifera]|uniref:Valine--tRNA ligase, chloroplastic/mitochondrial 2 n=1 Tax=Vitis vinifera TaxID=29760 RepID=A0A438I0I6_VITVI|nr:Valine--tRNA ligase, chloroplastic/mitochondrial 2 [Vitis vinifera]